MIRKYCKSHNIKEKIILLAAPNNIIVVLERNQNEIMHSIPLDNEMVLQGINGKTNKNVENQLCNELQWNKFSF